MQKSPLFYLAHGVVAIGDRRSYRCNACKMRSDPSIVKFAYVGQAEHCVHNLLPGRVCATNSAVFQKVQIELIIQLVAHFATLAGAVFAPVCVPPQ
jgi:hypothetical protein